MHDTALLYATGAAGSAQANDKPQALTFTEYAASGVTHKALDVYLVGGLTVSALYVDITGDTGNLDLDNPSGDAHEVFAIGLPGHGGHVIGGTEIHPLYITPVTPTFPYGGQATMAAANTLQQLRADGEVQEVLIQADPDPALCAGYVTVALEDNVGNKTDTIRLRAGDTIVVPFKFLKRVWVKSTIINDQVNWLAVA